MTPNAPLPFPCTGRLRRLAGALLVCGSMPLATGLLQAQQRPAEAAARQASAADTSLVLATVDAALVAITAEDMIALTDLMLDDAVVSSVVERNGEVRYSSRTRADERGQTLDADIVERGFDPQVQMAGALATVWLPYDLYVNGEWSHCGIDAFTLLRVEGSWKIAALSYTIEQPPACRPHPDGPPR